MASVRSCVYTPSGALQGIKILLAVLPRADSLTSVMSCTQDEKHLSLNQRVSWIRHRGKKERKIEGSRVTTKKEVKKII